MGRSFSTTASAPSGFDPPEPGPVADREGAPPSVVLGEVGEVWLLVGSDPAGVVVQVGGQRQAVGGGGQGRSSGATPPA
jgi:hypothetical protein